MKSGRKKFDGYDAERNVLIDSKDWSSGKDGWPVKDQDWSTKKVLDDARDQARIGKEVGAKVEWHVPTKEKAAEINKILDKGRINGIDVKVTPKNN